jgi:ASPM-SPD-2-Hydin domain-containing protein/HYDIN/CFA65/VesB family protein
VLQTADNGLTWQVLGLGMPTVDVVTVALDAGATPDLLRAGTYGRSVFELGAAQGPLLAINSTFNFGTLCPGQTPTELLQLFNVGTSDLTISSISRVTGSSDFTLTGPSFPVTITAGEELDFTVSFTPKLANEGTTETATFQIDSNDAVNPTRQIIYTATVGQPNGSTVIANGGNFGNVCVGSFADLNLTIANKGTCDLLVSSISSNDADFLPPSTLSYPLAVQAGTSVAAPVRFEPLSNGTKVGVITVDSSNNPGGNMSVNVTGTASPGHIAVSGSGTFGNVCSGANAQQTITVANTGPCNLHVTGASINCPDFTIEGNPFPATLSPDSSLPLTIAFTPTSTGPKSCTLTITSDDPSNPIVTVPLTATTSAVSIDVPPDAAPFGYNFPATVIQSVGACSSKNPFPVSNNGSCPTTITAVTIGPPNPVLPGSNPADYSLAGLPSLTTPLQAGHILGEGNLNTVFKPTLITRAESAAVTVTYESDPITHATTSVSRNLCGEGTSRGARVLVTAGGVPLTSVDKIQLHRLNSNRKAISIDSVNDAPLQTVTQTAPCASFQFQREWGGVTNPIQLTAGDYQITVDATVDNKKVSKTVSFTLDTCSFDQNIMVAF